MIRLAGGNEYKEGTIPDPLLPGQEEPGYRVWREWCQKSKAEQEAEIEAEREVVADTDDDGLGWGGLAYLLRGRHQRRARK